MYGATHPIVVPGSGTSSAGGSTRNVAALSDVSPDSDDLSSVTAGDATAASRAGDASATGTAAQSAQDGAAADDAAPGPSSAPVGASGASNGRLGPSATGSVGSIGADATGQGAEQGDIYTPTSSRSRGSMMNWLRSWRVDSKDVDALLTKGPPGSDDPRGMEPPPPMYEGSHMHSLSHCDPGFGLLGKVFPDLTIDTNRETCPRCNQKCVGVAVCVCASRADRSVDATSRVAVPVSPLVLVVARVLDEQIQEGWRRDPDDYTTACPYPECAAANGTDESKTSHSGSKGAKGAAAGLQPVRFVARFAVSSKAPFWEGSTGELMRTQIRCRRGL